jgi:hypothetical protein
MASPGVSRGERGASPMTSGIQGLRVLVAEDISLVAEELGAILQDYGCDVVGPVAV